MTCSNPSNTHLSQGKKSEVDQVNARQILKKFKLSGAVISVGFSDLGLGVSKNGSKWSITGDEEVMEEGAGLQEGRGCFSVQRLL